MRHQMWVGVVGAFAALLASGLATVVGCLPEQERTSYGPPETLGDRKFPNPENGGGPPPDAGPPPTNDICGPGQGPIDAGECNVKWSVDIFPKMFATPGGTLACSTGASCHAAGGTPPIIDPGNAKNAWAQLVARQTAGKKYVDPCTKDSNQSAILCNLGGTCASKMPLGGNPSATEADLTAIKTWLECGAPDN